MIGVEQTLFFVVLIKSFLYQKIDSHFLTERNIDNNIKLCTFKNYSFGNVFQWDTSSFISCLKEKEKLVNIKLHKKINKKK